MSVLKLRNGLVFNGVSFGAEIKKSIYGEVVFTTSMVGYPESCSDPSYKEQILVFTQPLIGNYGVPGNAKDDFGLSKYFESERIQVKAVIVADYATKYSHWNAKQSFGDWLKKFGVYGISGVDTRQLVSLLRDEGTMLGSIATSESDALIGNDFQNVNMIETVSHKDIKVYNTKGAFKIMLIDCGVKNNIIRCLAKRNAKVFSVPWNYDILSDPDNIKPDGILISNGPGSPLNSKETVENLKRFMDHQQHLNYNIPIFGICMGNQLLGLAAGFKVEKLLYGNRGHNQPVINMETQKCVLTSQNHGYALIDAQPLDIPKGWKTFFKNANDGSNEGIKHLTKPWSSVQFHPEAMGGPLDTIGLFDDFINQVIECRSKWVTSKGQCPHCRSSVTTHQLIKIDWASDVLESWQQLKFTGDKCQKHILPKEYWCNTCKSDGCADCFLLGSDHVEHEITKCVLLHKSLLNDFRTNRITSLEEQKNYWIRYKDDLSRQLSEFNLECLQKRNNEEELFNSFKESDQLVEENLNSYFESCLTEVEAKIETYAKALEAGEMYLKGLSLGQMLLDPQKHFNHAVSLVKNVCGDAHIHKGAPQSLEYQCLIPEYDSATFTITEFNRFGAGHEIKISPVTRFSGAMWRLKVYTFESEKTNAMYLSVFVELFQGSPGQFEYKIQLLEADDEFDSMPNLTKTYKSHFKESECWGYQKFVKLDDHFKSLYYNHSNDSITLVYSIRPATYYQKCLNLQSYILELEQKSKNTSLDVEPTTQIEYVSAENHQESETEHDTRYLEDVSIEARESQITLAEESEDQSNTIVQQIEETDQLVKSTFLDTSSTSSLYESSTEAANTIFNRILSAKSEKEIK